MIPIARGWLAFALVYCAAVVGMFAVSRLGDNEIVYIVMLAALFPTIALTYVPIYIVAAALDTAVGSTEGSAMSDVAFSIGITLTALVNVGVFRVAFATAKRCRLWRRSITPA